VIKVEGTAVYGANDTKIGSIERVMIDKMSGKVSYAVRLSCLARNGRNPGEESFTDAVAVQAIEA
jgi:hypothetical protein